RTYYEVFVYSFYDSNEDGIGDIKGVTSKLDYIEDMGFNGIWLMPIMPSTTYHKYDVIDYYNIDEQYGSMDDFKELIAECDKRGIKVIIDLVLNHTSTKNEWFQSAIKSLPIADCKSETCTLEPLCSKHNKYCSYYNFEKEKPAGGKYCPTGTGSGYYEAMFWDQMPDLNLANLELRKDIEDIMKFWLDMGVGGFRLDAAKEFYSGNTTKNVEVLKWVTDYCKAYDENTYVVAEVWENFATMSDYYESGVDSLFNFSHSQAKGKIATTINLKGEADSGLQYGKSLIDINKTIKEKNPNGIDAPFFTNHDTARAAGYFAGDEKKIKLAWGMNLMMNGSAFVYYGEELGMSGSGIDENKRAPMVWSDTNKVGMTFGPPNMQEQQHKFSAVDVQLKDENSILNYVKRAVRIRNENPQIARGELQHIGGVADIDICAIEKTYGNSAIVLLYNISDQTKSVNLLKSDIYATEIRGYLSTSELDVVTLNNGTVTIPPYSIAILK
ncbi:MAG: alpha-amylase family glycosyl hydrolase, partial [Oscillospiraceae bacterium]